MTFTITRARIMIGAAALALVAGATLLTQQRSDATFSTEDAANLVETAIAADQEVLVPATQQTESLSAMASVPRVLPKTRLAHPGPSLLSQTKERGTSRLARYFTGAALTKSLKSLDSGLVQQQADDFVVYGGGASNFKVLAADPVSNNEVAMKVSADTWSGVGQIQGANIVLARPVNTIIVSATVVSTSDGLRISDYSWDFAPGSAP